MEIEVSSVGLTVDVDDFGRFKLPDRLFTPAELNKIAREVNRAIRLEKTRANIEENEDG